MFELTNLTEARLASVTNRIEKHGDEDVPAVSLTVEFRSVPLFTAKQMHEYAGACVQSATAECSEHWQRRLDAAVAAERERWKQAAEGMAQEADHKFTMDGTTAHWLRALVAKRGPNDRAEPPQGAAQEQR